MFSFYSSSLFQVSQQEKCDCSIPAVLYVSLLPLSLYVLGNNEISSISRVTMSPSRPNNIAPMHSHLPLSKSSYNVLSAFCTEENIPQCISYINQVQ